MRSAIDGVFRFFVVPVVIGQVVVRDGILRVIHLFHVMPTPVKPMYEVATLNWDSQHARTSSPVAPLAIVPTVIFQAPTSARPTSQRLASPPPSDLRDSSGSSTAVGTIASDPDTLVPSAPNPKSKSRLRWIFRTGKAKSTQTSPQTSPLSQELKPKSWFNKVFSRKNGTPK